MVVEMAVATAVATGVATVSDRSIRVIAAGGDSKGGGGGGISEAPDSLSSVAFVQVVEVIGEGEIEGLVNNEYSVYIDGVPLRDLQGTPNYRPFTLMFRNGTQDQEYMEGFTGTLQTTDVSAKLYYNTPLMRVVPDQYTDAIRVTISVNGLSETTDKGEIIEASVQFRIAIKKASGNTWVQGPIQTIKGKTSSKYQRSIEMMVSSLGTPDPAGYHVQVTRLTENASSSLLVNDVYWDAYTSINYEKYTYPLRAMAAVRIDSRYFSTVPTRSYHVRGRRIAVPKNYDPVTREYRTTGTGTTNGAWDGTFKIAYSNNPAWCYYDMLISTRYGLGRRLSVNPATLSSPFIDKFALYNIARYCDEKVPTGLNIQVLGEPSSGGFDTEGVPFANVPINQREMEPRFTLNVVINTQSDAYKMLGQLSSVFRGMSYWAESSLIAVQDAPGPVEFILTNANVKGGKFKYQGTSRAQRRTVAIVGWNDPKENFRQRYEYVQDVAGIKKWGVRSEEFIQFGCTSQAEARRAGLWFLYTEKSEKEGIVTTGGLDSAYILPGMIGEVYDRYKAGQRWGGRTLEVSVNQVKIDKAVNLVAGNYEIKIRMPDGTLEARTLAITVSGDKDVFDLVPDLPAVPVVGSLWGLTSDALSPRIVRCINRTQAGADGYEFLLVEHNPSKFDAIEIGAALKQYDFSSLDMDDVDVVKGLSSKEYSFKPYVGAPTQTNVLLAWDQITSPLHRTYRVRMVSANYTFEVKDQTDSSVEFKDVSPDTYTVSVWAINQFGKLGPEAKDTIVVTGSDSVKPGTVTGFTYAIEGMNGVRLKWTTLQDYIDVYIVKEGESFDTGVLIGESKSDSLPPIQINDGLHKYWIKARDTSLNLSDEATLLQLDLAAIEPPIVSTSFLDGQVIFDWSEVASPLPIVAYDFRYGSSWASGVPVASPAKAKLPVIINWTGVRSFMVVARDSAGNTSQVVTVPVDVANPLKPTGLTSAFRDSDVAITWVEATGPLPIREFEVSYGPAEATAVFLGRTSAKTFTTPATWLAGAPNARRFWVKQIDSQGNVGAGQSIDVTITAKTVSGLSGAFTGSKYKLTWAEGTGSLRVDEYIVRFGASFDAGTAVTSLKGTTFESDANWVGARVFWVATKDSAGNVGAASSVSLTISVPTAPVVTTKVNQNYAAEVTFTEVTGTLPVAAYEVSWTDASNQAVAVRTASRSFTTDITWSGNKVFTVKGVDSAGNLGTGGTSTLVITAPSTPVLAQTEQTQTEFIIRWTCAQGSLPLKEFDVRHGASFDTGTLVGTLTALTITVKGSWSGNRVYWVRAKDTAGNVSGAGSVTISITPPIAPTVGSNVIDNNVLLRWSDSKQTMPISTYSVYRAANQVPFAQSALIGNLLGLFTTVFESTKGYYDYYVTATDSAGNTSAPGKVTAYISQPPDYQIQLDRDSDFNGVNYEFSANGNVEGWTVGGATQSVVNGVNVLTSTGTDPTLLRNMQDQFFYGCEHPIILMKVRRVAGTGWQGDVYYSTVGGHGLGESWKKTKAVTLAVGQSTVIAWDMRLNNAGNDDWMASRIDTLRFDLGTAATDIFEIDWIRLVPWVGTNVLLEEDNTLSLPVDTTETYEGHFTARSWTNPQAQVSAGFTRFIQPVPLTASYEEVIDYGAILPGTQIQVTPTANVVMGTLESLMSISVKKNWADAWVTTTNTTNIYASDFRYIKITVNYTGIGNNDMIVLQKLNVKLALKIRTDSGSAKTGGPVHVQGNLVDYSTLVAGTALPSGWVRRPATETSVAIRTGPNAAFPQELCILAGNTDVGSNEDGGFSTNNVTLDVNSDYIFACFVKRLTANGISRLETSPSTVLTLAGATSAYNGFVSQQLPVANQWYLLVGYVHNVAYGTTDLGFSGIYDLYGTKVASGTSYKFQSGFPTLYLGCLHMNNTVDTTTENQQMLRPVILKADPASFNDKLKYILNCATKDGVFIPFTQNPIDVSSVSVNVLGSKPLIPMYDFYDIPYPKGMNVFVFDSTGAFVAADVSWSINGTW